MSVQRRSPQEQARFLLDRQMAIGQAKHRREKNERGELVKVRLTDDKIHSSNTKRNYVNSLVQLARYTAPLKQAGYLHRLKEQHWREWLEKRSREVGQKQLSNDRRAIEVAYRVKLTPIKSEIEQHLKSRAYPVDQVQMVMQRQGEKNALATEISHRCGLRAHELYTLRPIAEQPPSDRRGWRDDRFGKRIDGGVLYTVHGKGGLIRTVCMPRDLAERLEARRLDEPRDCYDRSVDGKERLHYVQHYDIGAGGSWSKSFSDASFRALGWSNGAHGLRHSYAQERMEEEMRNGRTWNDALEVVSQEMGHFRETITLSYLR